MLHALLADEFSFWLPKAASKNAAGFWGYDALFYFILAINIIFSSLIMAILIYFVIRYRHRKGVKNNPTAGHSTALELTWTIIPTLIVLVIFYFGFKSYLRANVTPPTEIIKTASGHEWPYEITATGQTWFWTFTYPNGHSDPELHLIKGMKARMVLDSPDVLHDLDVPAFRMKKDVVPGRYNREWFEPDVASVPAKPSVQCKVDAKSVPGLQTVEEAGAYGLYTRQGVSPLKSADLDPGDTYGFQMQDGKCAAVYTRHGHTITIALSPTSSPEYIWKLPYEYYDVYCAMYCGQGHSIMRAKCVVHETKDEWVQWLEEVSNWEDKEPYIDHGKKLASQLGCSTCHSTDGSRLTGPTWRDMYGSTVEFEGGIEPLKPNGDWDAYIAESIRNPRAKIVKTFSDAMPTSFGGMKDNDVKALTWYMKSISKNVPESELAGGRKKPSEIVGPTTGPTTNPGPNPAAPPGGAAH